MAKNDELNAIVGINIQRERKRAGLTQDELSEMIGMGPKSLSAIERGAVGISLSSLRKVCDVLSISSNRLLYGETPERDVQDLAESLARLSPEQFSIATNIMRELLAAFKLSQSDSK